MITVVSSSMPPSDPIRMLFISHKHEPTNIPQRILIPVRQNKANVPKHEPKTAI